MDLELRGDTRRQLAKLLDGSNITEEQLETLVSSYAGLMEKSERASAGHRRQEKKLIAAVVGSLVLAALLWWTLRSPVVRLNEDTADAVLEVPTAFGWEERTIRYWEVPPDDGEVSGWYYRTAAGEWAPLLGGDYHEAGTSEFP